MRHKTISICQGQNCANVGGKELAKQLKYLNIPFKIIACQSLCSYAPTAKLDHIAILHASIDKLHDT